LTVGEQDITACVQNAYLWL